MQAHRKECYGRGRGTGTSTSTSVRLVWVGAGYGQRQQQPNNPSNSETAPKCPNQNMDAIEIEPSDNSEHEEHGIVSTVEICRVCLLDNLAMRDLFLENGAASLSAKAMSFANVKMSPGDGLPGQVCCMCVEKLESAYEFKLQVEHADTILRERFLTMNMKEELFFNEVEVHLESDRQENSEEMPMDAAHYQAMTASLTAAVSDHACSAMKDTSLTLIPIGKVDQLEQRVAEQESGPTSSTKIESTSDGEGLHFLEESNAEQKVQGQLHMPTMMAENMEERPGETTACMSINVSLKREREADIIGPEEHDYILQTSSLMAGSAEVSITGCESDAATVNSDAAHTGHVFNEPALRDEERTSESNEQSAGFPATEVNNSHNECERSLTADNELPHAEDETSQVQMRRSKRNLSRKSGTDDNDSIEENYFENLNLSSRLKKAQIEQADNNDKVFFACYLCDKQFLTKDLLKEHLHSHEEVRKTLLLKKAPEKSQKPISDSNPHSMPPSGRKANKCPYCGKEYLYIISFNKHLKQHEREKEEDGKDATMPLEVSLEEDEQSFGIEDDYSSRRKSIADGRKRRRRYQSPTEDNTESKVEDEERVIARGGDQEDKGKKVCRDEDDKEDAAFDERAPSEESDRLDGGKQWRKRCRIGDFECDKCSDTFSNKRDFRKHANTHLSLRCSVCQEEFDTLEKLRNHRTKHVLEGVLTEQDLEESAKLSKSDAYVEQSKKEEEEEEEEEDGEDEEGGAITLSPNAIVASDDNEDSDYHDNFNTNGGLARAFHRNRKGGELRSGSHYNCKLCDQRFARRELLQRHIDQQHPQIKAYKCTECNKSFGNELTLRNHLIATNHKTFVHGQEYDPNKRIKRVAARAAQRIIDKIKTEDGLEELEEDEDNEGGLCSDLERSMYGRRREATAQRRTYAKKELECANCGKRCSSKQALSKHMEQHTKEERMEKLEKPKKFNVDRKDSTLQKNQRTSVTSANKDGSAESERGSAGNHVRMAATGNGAGSCGGGGSGAVVGGGGGAVGAADPDDDDSDFESGLDWPMDNHECATCKKRYSTKKSLLRHQLLHEEPNFECDICNVKFYRKDKLKAHYDKCSEKNPDQVRKCNICGDSFENNEMLREHRAKHVTEGILTEEDLRDIEPRPEEKRQGERVGRKRRTDIVGLECTECNKQYTSRKGLLRHIQVHEGKKYLCDICPKKFYRREHLKIHVAKHNMIKPYKCNRCTKRFIKEEQLTNHLSKHDRTFKKNKETDSTKRFLCEICSKSFTQSTTLIAHLRAHNGIKPYVCEVCSRPFTTNAYLKMHMRTHTQERPYICQYCSRAFARADTLANHLTSHTGEAKYHCKYCPKNFRRLKSLKEHVFIHTGQRPYACPTCDRRFNNNGSRYAHSKRCKQNFAQNQNRAQNMVSAPLQTINQHQNPNQQRLQQPTITTNQIVKTQNIKTIAIARQPDPISTQQVMQHQEILMPLIFEILPEGTKIFTTT